MTTVLYNIIPTSEKITEKVDAALIKGIFESRYDAEQALTSIEDTIQVELTINGVTGHSATYKGAERMVRKHTMKLKEKLDNLYSKNKN